MKDSNTHFTETARQKFIAFTLIEDLVESMVAKQDKILNLLQSKPENPLNGFITERKAMELLNKKTTWFWQMRKTGRLSFKKIGKTVYYPMEQINALFGS